MPGARLAHASRVAPRADGGSSAETNTKPSAWLRHPEGAAAFEVHFPVVRSLFKQTWAGPAGSLTLEEVGNDVVRISMSGRADAGSGRSLAMALGNLLRAGGRRRVFWDLWDLEAYDWDVRTACTHTLMRHLKNLTSIYV